MTWVEIIALYASVYFALAAIFYLGTRIIWDGIKIVFEILKSITLFPFYIAERKAFKEWKEWKRSGRR